jgi:hypothetical protein
MSALLTLSLKAELPLIAVNTEDTINVQEVLSFYAGMSVAKVKSGLGSVVVVSIFTL